MLHNIQYVYYKLFGVDFVSDFKSCTTNLFETQLNISNVSYITTNDIGVQVLLPDMQFNCNGSITYLEGLVFLPGNSHFFVFQIWRPTSNNTYSVIASQFISEGDPLLKLYGTSDPNIKRFNLTGKNLNYQKEDIVGYYLPPSTSPYQPFLPVFSTNNSGGGRVYYTRTKSVCSMALCSPGVLLMEDIKHQMIVNYSE